MRVSKERLHSGNDSGRITRACALRPAAIWLTRPSKPSSIPTQPLWLALGGFPQPSKDWQ